MVKLLIVGPTSREEMNKLMEILKTVKGGKDMGVIIGRSGLISTPEPRVLELRRYENHDLFDDMRQEEILKREKQEARDFIASKSGKRARHNGIFKSGVGTRKSVTKLLTAHRKRGN